MQDYSNSVLRLDIDIMCQYYIFHNAGHDAVNKEQLQQRSPAIIYFSRSTVEPSFSLINPSHKTHEFWGQVSQNAPFFVTEMCTYVHISVTKWCIVGYGTGALWDLGMGPIEKVQNKNIKYMGQVTKLRLSCYMYLVLLSIDSKTR